MPTFPGSVTAKSGNRMVQQPVRIFYTDLGVFAAVGFHEADSSCTSTQLHVSSTFRSHMQVQVNRPLSGRLGPYFVWGTWLCRLLVVPAAAAEFQADAL